MISLFLNEAEGERTYFGFTLFFYFRWKVKKRDVLRIFIDTRVLFQLLGVQDLDMQINLIISTSKIYSTPTNYMNLITSTYHNFKLTIQDPIS